MSKIRETKKNVKKPAKKSVKEKRAEKQEKKAKKGNYIEIRKVIEESAK